MAKNRPIQPTTPTTQPTPPVDQTPQVDQTPPVDQSIIDQDQTSDSVRTVTVRAVNPPFIDLIKNVRISGEFDEVEWHPWLQANIDAGLLVEETE